MSLSWLFRLFFRLVQESHVTFSASEPVLSFPIWFGNFPQARIILYYPVAPLHYPQTTWVFNYIPKLRRRCLTIQVRVRGGFSTLSTLGRTSASRTSTGNFDDDLRGTLYTAPYRALGLRGTFRQAACFGISQCGLRLTISFALLYNHS